jgi:hypothetical protein
MKEEYDNIYLCIKKKTTSQYKCTKYDSYSTAEKVLFSENFDEIQSSAVLSVCKFVPNQFISFIINYKLSNIMISSVVVKDTQ